MKNRIIDAYEELNQLRKMKQRHVLINGSLHIAQPAMLDYVRNHPGCSQKQMADEARVSPACISASFKRLENARLIMRRTDTADTRCRRVYITEAGERELDNCLSAIRGVDDDMLSALDEDDLIAFERCLRKMIENLRQKDT